MDSGFALRSFELPRPPAKNEKHAFRKVSLQGIAPGWRDVELLNVEAAAAVVLLRAYLIEVGAETEKSN